VSRRALKLAAFASLAFAALATQALGTGVRPITAYDNYFNPGFQDEGLQMVLVNEGSNPHDVISFDPGPDGKELFRSAIVPGSADPGSPEGPVEGTQFLSAGTYEFFCSIHAGMDGTMTVSTTGTPIPRPEISLKLKSKKLEKVLDSGKLKVKVEAAEPTDAEGISLQARKGKKAITKKKSLALGAGDSETAKLKLKKNAAGKLAELEKAKVKVSGTVDFGFGDKASKKLK